MLAYSICFSVSDLLHAALYTLTWAYNLAKGKTTNIYSKSQYAFGAAHDFGVLWKQRGFLPLMGKKF